MIYKGYEASVEWDVSSSNYHGKVLGMRDMIHFCSPTMATLYKEFVMAVDDYLEFCNTRGYIPDFPKPKKVSDGAD